MNYVDGTGITRKCVVLYGPENENYQSYGIQIITMETVEDVELGNGTGINHDGVEYIEIVKESYNNLINILNTKSQAYLNTTYASGARSVGSVPNNPMYDGAGMYTKDDEWFTDYNGVFKNADENYLTDWEQMNMQNIQNISKAYWLASRYANPEISAISTRAPAPTAGAVTFNVRYVGSKRYFIRNKLHVPD